MATLAAFPAMLDRDRKRWGMRECQAAWCFGVSLREYRELEAGESFPTLEVWGRICELYGWPQTLRRLTAVNEGGPSPGAPRNEPPPRARGGALWS